MDVTDQSVEDEPAQETDHSGTNETANNTIDECEEPNEDIYKKDDTIGEYKEEDQDNDEPSYKEDEYDNEPNEDIDKKDDESPGDETIDGAIDED